MSILYLVNTFSAGAWQEIDPFIKKKSLIFTLLENKVNVVLEGLFFSKCCKFYVDLKNAIKFLEKYNTF